MNELKTQVEIPGMPVHTRAWLKQTRTNSKLNHQPHQRKLMWHQLRRDSSEHMIQRLKTEDSGELD